MTSLSMPVRRESATSLPDLWVITVALGGHLVDVESLVRLARVSPDRFVFVSDYAHRSPTLPAIQLHARDVQRESQLWNLGLSYVRNLQEPGSPWDVALVSPEMPLSRRRIDALRHHMRMLDTWMAEPDFLFQLEDRDYSRIDVVNPRDVPAPSIVVPGEFHSRFDTRFPVDSDSWVEFCHRNTSIGGSVLLSRNCWETA